MRNTSERAKKIIKSSRYKSPHCISYNFGHQIVPLALQHCFGLPYWHYQPLFRCFDSPPPLSLFVSKNLENWEEKENCFQKSHKSRRERDFFLNILKIEKRKRFVFQNLINREEKEKFFLKILKIKKRKRMDLKISQIEKRNRIFF